MNLSKHVPYEEWLLAAGDPQAGVLTPEQQIALRQHLETCPECRRLDEGWRAAGETLRRANPVAPAEGFTLRWQQRLLAERERMHRRQSLAMLGFSLAGALLLFASLLLLVGPWLDTPRLFVWAWAARLIWLFVYLAQLGRTVAPALQGLGQAIPLAWWVLLAGMLTMMSVFWVVTFRWAQNLGRVAK